MKIKKRYRWNFKFTDLDLKKFSKLSGDNHPIHSNKNFAKKKGFRNKVVYGVLLASQISKLIGNEINNKNIMMVGFNIEFYNSKIMPKVKFQTNPNRHIIITNRNTNVMAVYYVIPTF